MKTYVMTTGVIFALLVLAHIVRVAGGETALVRDPFFIGATIVPLALCVWAWRLLRRPPAA